MCIRDSFTGPTAPMVKGMPVFYHFGPGAKVDEYKKVLSQVKFPQGMKQPVALRRWADWGKLENDKYISVTRSDDMDAWEKDVYKRQKVRHIWKVISGGCRKVAVWVTSTDLKAPVSLHTTNRMLSLINGNS